MQTEATRYAALIGRAVRLRSQSTNAGSAAAASTPWPPGTISNLYTIDNPKRPMASVGDKAGTDWSQL